MSIQLYSHSKSDLEKMVEIILTKAQNFVIPNRKEEEQTEDLITQTAAAKFLHMSIPTIINHRKNKDLPHYNFSGRYFYSKKELLDYGRKRNQNIAS